MPMLDGTGPNGLGPMTGRGLGPCSGNAPQAGWRRFFGGFGRGRGLGLGRGFGFFGQQLTQEERKDWLEAQKEAIETELKNLPKDK